MITRTTIGFLLVYQDCNNLIATNIGIRLLHFESTISYLTLRFTDTPVILCSVYVVPN